MSRKTHPAASIVLRFLPMIGWMVLIFMLSHQPTLPTVPGVASSAASIAGHFSVYFVLAILLWWTLGLFDLSPRQRILLAFIAAVLFGFSDEWHQSFVSGRDASLMDNAVDAVGAATGLGIIHLLHRTDALPDEWT